MKESFIEEHYYFVSYKYTTDKVMFGSCEIIKQSEIESIDDIRKIEKYIKDELIRLDVTIVVDNYIKLSKGSIKEKQIIFTNEGVEVNH